MAATFNDSLVKQAGDVIYGSKSEVQYIYVNGKRLQYMGLTFWYPISIFSETRDGAGDRNLW
jgi:hypothetical protein